MRQGSIIRLSGGFALSLTLSAGFATGATGAVGSHRFPTTVHAANGVVRIATRPTRILSLSASATQMLYAVGAGRQVVGVDKYSTYPKNAPRTGFTGYESNAEDYLRLRPDLVVFAYDTNHLVEQLAKLSIPALVLPPATSLASVRSQFVELGQATGHLAAAKSAYASMVRKIATAVARAKASGRNKTYYIEFDPTFYTATSNTFVGTLFSRFGMKNVADSAAKAASGYPQLSAEYLVKANPQYVYLADTVCCGQSAHTFMSRPGLSVLRAVRQHHVFRINDSVASEWGPHSIVQMVRDIASSLESRRRTGAPH